MPKDHFAYAVLYARDGKFMIAGKVAFAYYFGNGAIGNIYPNGVAPKGAAQPAFPGGEWNPNESPVQAAEREFLEETAYPAPTANVLSASWIDKSRRKWMYYAAGYFEVQDGAAVAGFVTKITTTLFNAASIANAINTRTITAYTDIAGFATRNHFTPWPVDNELSTVAVWDILDPQTWQLIQTWQNIKDLDWYYTILAYLRQTILGIP